MPMDLEHFQNRFLLLTLCLMLMLAGCRVRTTVTGQDGAAPESETADAGQAGEMHAEAAEEALSGEADASGKTSENPEAVRKEYDENAQAEIVPGTGRQLHGEGEGSGTPEPDPESDPGVSRLDEGAEEPAVQTEAAEEAEDQGVSEDAAEADSALTYYTVLVSSRTGALFECQRVNVYWETPEDHVTVYKTSPEHALILAAGAYDVSARLLEENLRVDDGWVTRKDPGVIVKIVPGSVLGSGVASDGAAAAVYRDLLAREGWSGIDAVRSGRVVLLSEELLTAPHLQTAAELVIARTAYPGLFEETDLNEALRKLHEEAAGTVPGGIFFYPGGKDLTGISR